MLAPKLLDREMASPKMKENSVSLLNGKEEGGAEEAALVTLNEQLALFRR